MGGRCDRALLRLGGRMLSRADLETSRRSFRFCEIGRMVNVLVDFMKPLLERIEDLCQCAFAFDAHEHA